MRGKRVLLVGGGGFIGRALGLRLSAMGAEVHVLSRRAEPGMRDGIAYHRGNQADAAVAAPLLARCEMVVHLASTTTPGRSAHSPLLETRENLDPLAGFLEALAAAGPRRILYFSSGGAIYGNPASLPATEDHPLQPLSWHAAGKVAAEDFLRTHARQVAGTALAILRPANVYGPGQALQAGFGIVRTLLEKAHRGAGIDLWGDGSQVRDYLYIDDLVEACVGLLAAPAVTGTFNAGSGAGTSLLELVRLAEQVSGRPIPVTRHSERGIDVAGIWLDSSRLQAATGWQATTPLAEGLARTWAELMLGAAPAAR